MITPASRPHDVFISHAGEDKARFVDALVVALRQRGVTCWYDSDGIQLGDDFRIKMDEGLAHARYGVVILSQNFFKYWPQAELSALFNQEATFEQSRILPVRLDVDRTTVTMRLPLLAARADISWDHGVETVADRIRDVVRGENAKSSGVFSRPYNLPARRVQTLFGRDADIDHVLDLLRPGRSVRVAASVEGLAGVGKTELALHVVDRLSQTDRFPGGIFWFDAENPNLAPAWGGVIADALAVGPGTLEERAAGAIRLASNGPPVLVVLDNVESWTKDTEPRPLPGGPHVSVLVTTRHKWLGGVSFQHHTLEVLDTTAAHALLQSVSGRVLDRRDGTQELLAHLDGHALALELAGAYLHEFPSVSPRQYLSDLVAGGRAEDRVKDSVRYERSVRQALDVHIRHLDGTTRSALQIAACFAPEDASTSLLERCSVTPDRQQPLRRFHLITGTGERWRMHRLVRSWVHNNETPEERAIACRAFIEGCLALAVTIDLEEGFRIYRTDGPHLEQAVAAAEQVFREADDLVAVLLDRLGTALQSAGDLAGAKDRFQRALAYKLKNHEVDHPSVANIHSNLALVLAAMGDSPQAKELLQEALASTLRSFGVEHPAVAVCRSNLATVLISLGDLPQAKELLEQALASDLKNLGADHPSLAIRRSNLAAVLYELGEIPRSRELVEQALESDLKNLGDDHPLVANRRSNLATILWHSGDRAGAQELLEQALESTLKTLGVDHPLVATHRSKLGQAYVAQNDLARARALLTQALEVQERTLGPDHPDTAYARVSLARVLFLLGEAETARREAERAVKAVSNLPSGAPSRGEIEAIARHVLKDDILNAASPTHSRPSAAE